MSWFCGFQSRLRPSKCRRAPRRFGRPKLALSPRILGRLRSETDADARSADYWLVPYSEALAAARRSYGKKFFLFDLRPRHRPFPADGRAYAKIRATL